MTIVHGFNESTALTVAAIGPDGQRNFRKTFSIGELNGRVQLPTGDFRKGLNLIQLVSSDNQRATFRVLVR